MSTAIINGRVEPLPDDPDALLIDVLRSTLGLTGAKLVCGAGVCGACAVLVDGAPVAACLLPAQKVAGKSVTTVEGLGAEALHPIQKAFIANDALQCGFCTPGFIVEAAAFHDAWRAEKGKATPSREEIGAALSGHLCRCGAYDGIFQAVAQACAGQFDRDDFASPRLEARAKVTGAAKYTVDIQHPGQLEGAILRSPVPHAKVVALDLRPAVAIPGVAAAVSLLSADRIVRYFGQDIAAVAARDLETARKALGAIRVSFEARSSAIGLEAARAPGAPVIFPGFRKSAANASEGPLLPAPWRGNIRGPSAAFSLKPREARRALASARAAADPLLVEMDFRTGGQSHTCLEPHAAVARFDGETLTLHASTQAVFHMKSVIAKRFQLDVGKVRVIAEHIGGGFGSKGALTGETIAAVALAREAKAPVRVAFDRREELSVAGYRPGAEVKAALLANADGFLKSLSMTAHSDAGVAVNSTIAALARLMYPAEAMALADFDVVSNLPPGAPFRGPGGPVMAFALEQCVDEAAQRLQVDPIALRQRWDPNPNRRRLYDWAAGLDAWRGATPAAVKSGRFRRGIGVAAGFWLYLWQPGSTVEVAVVNRRLRISVAVQDIGTGIRSVLADTIAREFALEPSEVEVRIGDSDLPEGPTSAGSRTTASVVPAAILAAHRLKEALQRHSSADPKAGSNAPWRELIAASPDVAASAERPLDSRRLAAGVRSPIAEVGLMGHVFGWIMRRFNHLNIGAGVPSCVQVAEVEVDTWLGHVRVLKVHSGIAVGRIAAPALAHSQAAGSIIQGVGYALYEGREVDPRTGEVLTAGLEDYRIPGIADTPLIDVHFDESGFDHVPGGSVGIGEVATIPTSAAIANAIRNATGVRLTEIPIRPDRLIAALKPRSAA